MRCTAVLSNPLNAVKAESSEALPVSKIGDRDEMSKGDGDGKDTNSGSSLSSVGRSIS